MKNKMNKSNVTLVCAAVALIIANQQARAGGFSLYTESSAAALGNFAAGIAAEAADASTGWYNPAGLILIKKQEVLFSGIGVMPSTQLSGTSTFETIDFDPYMQTFYKIQGAEDAFVPAVHYVKPLGERAAFGFSINSPYGLSTNWGEQSPVRYSASLTELVTVNVSPEIAGMLTDNWSVGAGLDLEWAKVKFNAVLGSPAALQFLQQFSDEVTPTTLDSGSFNQGQSFGVGFHAGILGRFYDNHTRVGLNYQSAINHQFEGNSQLSGVLADPELLNPSAKFFSQSLYSNQIQLPYVWTFSGYQDINPQWALLGSIVYTGWNTFNSIQLNNVAAYSVEESSQSLENTTSIEDYRNTWRFAGGVNYRVNELWMMRAGGGYDQTPTIDAQRDVRLPDSNRWALSIGTHYQLKPNLGIDIGYTYLFGAGNANVNKLQQLGPTSSNTINATASSHVNLVGMQVVWDLEKSLVKS